MDEGQATVVKAGHSSDESKEAEKQNLKGMGQRSMVSFQARVDDSVGQEHKETKGDKSYYNTKQMGL